MLDKKTELEFRSFLEGLPVATLRIIGRMDGVPTDRSGNKTDLINGIVDILVGRTMPVPRSGRGAPVKQSYVDPVILQRLSEIRRKTEEPIEPAVLQVASNDEKGYYEQPICSGILEIMQGGYGFLRAKNCQPTNGGDVFIAAPMIHSLKLREGDYVACIPKPRLKNDSAAIGELLTVNGRPVGTYEERPFFDSLTASYPKERITMAEENNVLSLRLLDLFVPIGKGQRALIIAPPKAGKTTMLKDIARAISEHHQEIDLIVLLIDERPEEVTDFRTSVEAAEVIYSTFDEGAEHHIRAAELTIAHAKRLAEAGHDVVILLDSLTKLTRAYNHMTENSGKILSGGLDAAAFSEPKRFFGAARNTMEGGSITILATALVDTGSRMDDVIYEEFKGTGNCDIFLSRELAERRIFPAVDIHRSGTRKEELLLSREELSAVYKLRERGLTENVEGILDLMKKTQSNKDFITRLSEWLRVYKS